MELDKKIKVKKIFDCFSDFEEVKKYFDKEVYCADFIEKPAEFVEQEKQYRAYTIDEFLNHFDIGEVIVFRSKAMPDYVLHLLFVGYVENGKDNEVAIILGQHRYSLNDLFTNYEYDGGDNWFSFGVEE